MFGWMSKNELCIGIRKNEEENKMDIETIRLRKVWDILLVISISIGITLLMFNAFGGNRYFFELQECKALTYLFVEVLFARILCRILAKKKKLAKYLFVIAGGILLTIGIFFFNNALHFWGYASMFNYPVDLFYKNFLAADLHYTLGLGIIRYVLFFVVSLMSFALIEEGIVKKVCQWTGKVLEALLELIGGILEKVGLLKLFGLEYETFEDANDDRDKLIKILLENDNIIIHKKISSDSAEEYVVKLLAENENNAE